MKHRLNELYWCWFIKLMFGWLSFQGFWLKNNQSGTNTSNHINNDGLQGKKMGSTRHNWIRMEELQKKKIKQGTESIESCLCWCWVHALNSPVEEPFWENDSDGSHSFRTYSFFCFVAFFFFLFSRSLFPPFFFCYCCCISVE